MGIEVDGEAEPVSVELTVWLSNARSRRGRFTAKQLEALRELGMQWA